MTRKHWTLLLALACGGDERSAAGGHDDGEAGEHEEAGHQALGEAGHEDGGAEGHADEVALGPAALANARLRVEALTLAPVDARATVPARITLDPRQEARVSAVTAGALERILVRPGDRVKAGDPMATVLSPELGTAIGSHLAAAARVEVAEAHRERITKLHAGGFSSASELTQAEADYTVAAAEAEAAEERLRVYGVAPERFRPKQGQHFASRFSVRSPLDGEVLAIDVSLGTSVASGDPLFHVGNLDQVWLILDVYERHLSTVQIGAKVSFTAEAWGDEVFSGTVEQIGGWLDPASRTAEVRVVVDNPGHRLKPNMFANARLALHGAGAAEGLVLPGDAVQIVEGRPSAFVEIAEGRFAARAVQTEALPDGRHLVITGLQAGERVVVDGAFTLKSELAKSELGEGHAH